MGCTASSAPLTEAALQDVLVEVLEAWAQGEAADGVAACPSMSPEVCASMLRHDLPTADLRLPDGIDASHVEEQLAHVQVPTWPLVQLLGKRMWQWHEEGQVPLVRVDVGFEASVDHERLARVDELGDTCAGLSARVGEVADLLRRLELRGVLTLLGVQCTHGSIDALPPSPAALVAAFNVRKKKTKKQRQQPQLTVGARALSKHFHRGQERFWGELKGSELHKSQVALHKLLEVLQRVVWVNLHELPHQKRIFEVRIDEGYGARWSIEEEGIMFRGFLEPHSEDGHEVGWKH